jgi:hypothetical protein
MESTDLRYEDVRDQVRSGDVLMYKGKTLMSFLIHRVIRSPYSDLLPLDL